MNRRKIKTKKIKVEDFKNNIRYRLHVTTTKTRTELRLGFEVDAVKNYLDYYIEESGEILQRFTGLEHAVDTYNDIIGDK
tara:strand:+ start:16122 stop:16361 length:240 start_codon:yes stop_codon:yes gene_type:complete